MTLTTLRRRQFREIQTLHDWHKEVPTRAQWRELLLKHDRERDAYARQLERQTRRLHGA